MDETPRPTSCARAAIPCAVVEPSPAAAPREIVGRRSVHSGNGDSQQPVVDAQLRAVMHEMTHHDRAEQQIPGTAHHDLVSAPNRPFLRKRREIDVRQSSLLRRDIGVVRGEQLRGGRERREWLPRARFHSTRGENRYGAGGDVCDVRRELRNRPRVLVRSPVVLRIRKALEQPSRRCMLRLEIGIQQIQNPRGVR